MEKFLAFVMVIAVGIVAGILLLTKSTTPSSSPDSNLNLNFASTTPVASQSQQQQPTNSPKNYLYPQDEWVTNATEAAILTAKGTIVIQLYPQDAPKTVTNFATLAKKGYYDGLTFHRVEPGFVIQGGDPNGDGSGGRSIYGDTFEDELNPNTASYQAGYLEGVVAMANRGPNTNGSQFFIMLADNPSLPKNYTIFGKVISGMDVVQQIQVGDKMTSITIQ
ncbi:MAG TPA: peptidylprolyl isomerase [Candidatus Saccharimonadales bacterium]|nr:peptidylprolyl isomerase [Candidatus Saccharimonadales bacterium]